MLNLTAIEEAEDRSLTPALIDRLGEPAVLRVVMTLDDPRARVPLMRVLESLTADPVAREAAGQALRESTEGVHRNDVLRWWATTDPLLRRNALLAMGVEDEDIVAAVASSPDHPLHRDAIAAMQWGFEPPRFQRLKIAALDHPDPEVRATAADVVCWDEPVAAEDGLIRCAGDPDARVACAAVATLRYYPTRRCLERLIALRNSPDERLREVVEESLGDLRETMQPATPPAAQAPPLERTPATRLLRCEPDAVLADYGDLEGRWAEKKSRFHMIDWEAFTPAGRGRLAPFLRSHPDAWLRAAACKPLSVWNDHASLLTLLSDPSFIVMKSSAYGLGLTSRDPAAAAALRAHLVAPHVTSTHAVETLHAWVAHAGRAAVPELVAFAVDERESVRHAAIRALVEFGARDELESLLPLLETPPHVTWAVHIALLDACRKLRLPPRGLDTLRQVDNYWLEQALMESSSHE